jgi:uncharacterized protein with HEPN domain
MERMRHKIVHDDDRISAATVWRTISDDLAPLLPLLRDLLVKDSGRP